MGPVTTNPILIAMINMTVVFAVLYGLSLIVRLIQIIDPTQKKKIDQTELAKPTELATVMPTTRSIQEEDDMILLFTAAIAAYGHSDAKIVAIRPVGSTTWSQTARVEGVQGRNEMF